MARNVFLSVLLLAFATLVGVAAPAFAHGGHKAAHGAWSAAGIAENSTGSGHHAAPDENSDGKANAVVLPKGDATDPCDALPACCVQHCSIGAAVLPPPTVAATPQAVPQGVICEGRRPDDAPREARLRPPCD